MSKDWVKLRDLAGRLKQEGRFSEAINCLCEAIASAINVHPVDVILMHNKLANLYLLTEALKPAEMAARETIRLELQDGDRGRETTNLADFYLMLAKILEKQGRFREASEYSEKGLSIICLLLGESGDFFRGVKEYHEFLVQNSWRG